MRLTEKKSTFGIIIGTRNIFNAQLASAQREKLLAVLDALRIHYVVPDENETPAGAGTCLVCSNGWTPQPCPDNLARKSLSNNALWRTPPVPLP